MPTLEPNSAMASVPVCPLAISKNGTAKAISEFITLLAARDTVMGVEDLSSGTICPFGFASLPLAVKNHSTTAIMLTKHPSDSERAVM